MLSALGKMPHLTVDYPWTRHRSLSIEVRLVTGPPQWATTEEAQFDALVAVPEESARVDPDEVEPMRFRAEWLHGERLEHAMRRVGWIEKRNLPRIPVGPRLDEPLLISWRNHMGKMAIGAVEHYGDDPSATGNRTIPGLGLSLPWLKPFAIGDDLLKIDLPPDEFAPSGWIRVWMLRGGEPLWYQDLPWPGAPGAKSKPKPAER